MADKFDIFRRERYIKIHFYKNKPLHNFIINEICDKMQLIEA